MHTGKTIELNGLPVAGGRQPLICAPLVGRDRQALLAEAARVIAKRPDILEWRVDFFDGIGDTAEVLGVAAALRQAAGGIPVLFTRRSVKEGGERIALPEEAVVALYEAVCQDRCVELVDFEMSNDAGHVGRVRTVSRANGIKMVMSYHNFERTPDLGFLNQRFLQAAELGADVAKVAVMPQTLDDVLTLLRATLQSSAALDIPVISMSMGGYGAVTRMFGCLFGSSVTFAVGDSVSAPGQLPIEDLRTVLRVLQDSLAQK